MKKRFEENGPLKHQKGAGRPSNVRNKISYSCARYVQHDKQKPVREIASEISQKRGFEVSKSNVYRCLKDMGYSKPIAKRVPMLSEKKLFRMEWAKQNMNKHWYRAVLQRRGFFLATKWKVTNVDKG